MSYKDQEKQRVAQRNSYLKRKDVKQAKQLNRRRANKIRAVNYLGGKCCICGYNRCIAALDFHHVDPSSKEYEISRNVGFNWDKLVLEVDKCVLLCSNCHREVEAGFILLG